MQKSCPINIRTINPALLAQCAIVQKDAEFDKYILMEVPYISNETFYDILQTFANSKKHIILSLMESFSYLLEAIDRLAEKQIVHFDLKGDNILYNIITHNPQIIDFGISISLPFLKKENWIDFFYCYAPDYYLWPLEVHVINFLLYETIERLTLKNVADISAAFCSLETNKALGGFSAEFQAQYLQACKQALQPYLGQSKDEIIPVLLKLDTALTWDNYSLSVLYLKAFGYMFPDGFIANTIVVQFSQILVQNIHPDPGKRFSLEETKKKYKDIFYQDFPVEEYEALLVSFNYDPEKTAQRIKADSSQTPMHKRAHASISGPMQA